MKECNNCAVTRCDRKQAIVRTDVIRSVYCPDYQPPKPFKQRLIKCAIYHEMAERGEVTSASRLYGRQFID